MNAALRMPNEICNRLLDHLESGPGEHFAFLLCRTSTSSGEPIFLAHDLIAIPDGHFTVGVDGWQLDDRALDNIVNHAVRTGSSLVEAHNHAGTKPRFSVTDRSGLEPFARYACESLSGRPYGATVWASSTAWGEWFALDDSGGLRKGTMRTVSAVGSGRLRQLVSRDDDLVAINLRYDRQVPWFTPTGQRALTRLRVGVVGAGGTGSQVILALAYLGLVEYVLADPDVIDLTNLNRVVTATPADLGTSKVVVGRRAIRTINPGATVDIHPTSLHDAAALDALRGCDLIFGCVDNDGPRLALNAFALANGIPLVDVATGIFVDPDKGAVDHIGGRVAVVLPDGPCLSCMDEIDRVEARHYFAGGEESRRAEELGYVTGAIESTPAVVSLNGIAANAAITEAATMLVGPRPATPLLDLDVLGNGRPITGQWLTPRRVSVQDGCFECGARWAGKAAEVERLAPRDRPDPQQVEPMSAS